MKVSLNWLKEYIYPDFEDNFDPEVIAKKLTMAGLEVDGIEKQNALLNDIVVAKIKEVKKHPDADRLFLCIVDAGKDKLLNIVCGAPNVEKGMNVPCALEGVILPNDVKIKKNKIRGQVSEGMLCSSIELELGDDAKGIMSLDKDLIVGTPLGNALNLLDSVLEIDLTPNRADCLSMIGVAREVTALLGLGKKLKHPDYSLPQDKIINDSIHSYTKVEILDPDLCPRYSVSLLLDVKVGPSPFWLVQRLKSIGIASINNIVDITNYVMMETGQPLHAFDYDEIKGNKIIVRRAGEDESFKTLDDKVHKLDPDMLMICDIEKPIGLAGVMGGENSEISDSTTRVLLESANFNFVSIRRTAKKTGIASEASHRFERGVDPDGVVRALKRATHLIAKVAEAKIAKDIIDKYPHKQSPVTIELDIKVLNSRLGTNLNFDTIRSILESIEFKVGPLNNKFDSKLKVSVPFFRNDVARQEDLFEEIARLWGYDNIKITYPLVPAKGKPLDSKVNFIETIKQIMVGFSFFEVINYNFINQDFVDNLNLPENDKRRKTETILNPISDKMSVLRTSLISGILDTIRNNIARQEQNLMLFEIGKVFFAEQKDVQPEEKDMMAGIITGLRSEKSWYFKKESFDFFDLKGIIEALFEALKIRDIVFERIEDKACYYYKKGHSTNIRFNDIIIGSFGTVNENTLKNYGIKQAAFVFELWLEELQKLVPKTLCAKAIPKFHFLTRDITIIVDKALSAGSVKKQAESIVKKQPLIEKVFLFDIFEGENLKDNKKALSLRIVYRSANKNLEEKNIKKIHSAISKKLVEQFNALLPE